MDKELHQILRGRKIPCCYKRYILQLEHTTPLAPGDRVVLGHGNGYLLAEIE